MATSKKATKKKAAPSKLGAKVKKAAPKAAGAKKKLATPKKAVSTKKKAAPAPKRSVARSAALAARPGILSCGEGTGRRCLQREDGKFIRQNRIGGRWMQVGGTTFPTAEACLAACRG